MAQAVEDAFTSLKAGAESFKREQREQEAAAEAAEDTEEAEAAGAETEDAPPPEPAPPSSSTDPREDGSHAAGGRDAGEEHAHDDDVPSWRGRMDPSLRQNEKRKRRQRNDERRN